MRYSRSYKISKKIKLLAAASIAAAYLLGFTAKVYSPIHIGHYAIPIPIIIKSTASISQDDASDKTAVLSQTLQQSKIIAPVSDDGTPLFFTHSGITTTYFWVGEPGDKDNGYIPNSQSAWDGQWQNHFGGVDSPAPRNGYYPAAFTPKENPFYFALPYNDLDSKGHRKSTAADCPNSASRISYSWCKNSWIAIRYNGKIAYAQWEDVGPFGEDDSAYVFGGASPKNTKGAAAGLDVSPAVKDYLGLGDVSTADWVFVGASGVPQGPWKAVLTIDLGDSVN